MTIPVSCHYLDSGAGGADDTATLSVEFAAIRSPGLHRSTRFVDVSSLNDFGEPLKEEHQAGRQQSKPEVLQIIPFRGGYQDACNALEMVPVDRERSCLDHTENHLCSLDLASNDEDDICMAQQNDNVQLQQSNYSSQPRFAAGERFQVLDSLHPECGSQPEKVPDNTQNVSSPNLKQQSAPRLHSCLQISLIVPEGNSVATGDCKPDAVADNSEDLACGSRSSKLLNLSGKNISHDDKGNELGKPSEPNQDYVLPGNVLNTSNAYSHPANIALPVRNFSNSPNNRSMAVCEENLAHQAVSSVKENAKFLSSLDEHFTDSHDLAAPIDKSLAKTTNSSGLLQSTGLHCNSVSHECSGIQYHDPQNLSPEPEIAALEIKSMAVQCSNDSKPTDIPMIHGQCNCLVENSNNTIYDEDPVLCGKGMSTATWSKLADVTLPLGNFHRLQPDTECNNAACDNGSLTCCFLNKNCGEVEQALSSSVKHFMDSHDFVAPCNTPVSQTTNSSGVLQLTTLYCDFEANEKTGSHGHDVPHISPEPQITTPSSDAMTVCENEGLAQQATDMSRCITNNDNSEIEELPSQVHGRFTKSVNLVTSYDKLVSQTTSNSGVLQVTSVHGDFDQNKHTDVHFHNGLNFSNEPDITVLSNDAIAQDEAKYMAQGAGEERSTGKGNCKHEANTEIDTQGPRCNSEHQTIDGGASCKPDSCGYHEDFCSCSEVAMTSQQPAFTGQEQKAFPPMSHAKTSESDAESLVDDQTLYSGIWLKFLPLGKVPLDRLPAGSLDGKEESMVFFATSLLD